MTTGVFFKELMDMLLFTKDYTQSSSNALMFIIIVISQLLGALSAKAVCLKLLQGAVIFRYYTGPDEADIVWKEVEDCD